MATMFNSPHLIVCIILLGLSFSANGQIFEPAARARESILGHEAIERDRLENEFRDIGPPKQDYLEETQVVPKPKPAAQTFIFKHIYLDKATLLSAKAQKRLLKPFLNKPLSIEEINNILKVVTNEYIARGYVTTRAYLPPQNIAGGKLNILVVEGKIESFSIQENGKPRKYLAAIVPDNLITSNAGEGKNLNLRDLEQGIDQITRLSSYDAHINITPGDTDGASKVAIETSVGRKWGASSAVDNLGTDTVGRNQVELNGYYDDLLGIYDSIAINYRRNANGNNAIRHFNSFSGQFSKPFGYWTARYLGSTFGYLSTVAGQNQSFRISGRTSINRIELERILHRDGVGKTGASVGLGIRETKNFIEDVLLNPSSNIISLGEFRLFHVRRSLGGVFFSSISYVKGLPIFGATAGNNLSSTAPNPEFDKVKLDLSFARPFQLGTQEFSWNLQGAYQYSAYKLFSDDRLTVGGYYTVAGFQNTSINGDTGGYVRNALNWVITKRSSDPKNVFGSLEAFVGYDFGRIYQGKGIAASLGTLTGGVIGMRIKGSTIFGELAFSRSFQRPVSLQGEGTIMNFRLGVKI